MASMRGRRVVVTGATGHLGANLTRELVRRGADVRAVLMEDPSSTPPALDGLDVERIYGDVRDRDTMHGAVRGADVVYHLAAKVSITKADAPLVFDINVNGTATVVEACEQGDVGRLVHVSSVNAIDPSPVRSAVTEQRPANTNRRAAPYDRSKAEGEAIVMAAAVRGLDAVVISPTGMIGPHDHQPSPMGRLLTDLWRGRLPVISRGGFNWVDVRDVASTLVSAADRGEAGRRYIASGHWASLLEVCEIAAPIGGVRPPRVVTGHNVARAVAPLADLWSRISGSRPRITPASVATLRQYRLVLGTEAQLELGHEPRGLEDTLADTYAWFERSARSPELDRCGS